MKTMTKVQSNLSDHSRDNNMEHKPIYTNYVNTSDHLSVLVKRDGGAIETESGSIVAGRFKDEKHRRNNE